MTVDRRIIDLYNEYVHTALPRREFMTRLATIAGGSAAAMAILPFIEPNYAQARQIEPDDKRLKAEKIEFVGPQGSVKAYVAMPRKPKSCRASAAKWLKTSATRPPASISSRMLTKLRRRP